MSFFGKFSGGGKASKGLLASGRGRVFRPGWQKPDRCGIEKAQHAFQQHKDRIVAGRRQIAKCPVVDHTTARLAYR